MATPAVNGYVLGRVIGRGASGTVYEATREVGWSEPSIITGKSSQIGISSFAAKVFPIGGINTGILARLLQLNHPHLLTPIAVEETHGGEPCLILPFISHTCPHGVVKSGGVDSAIALLMQACAALSYLHGQEIVHGDIKPANLLCSGSLQSAKGIELRIADLDYAICSSLDARSTGVTGTLGYMAPEVLMGQSCSFSSDVFSLGAWFYWVLTGTELFAAQTIASAISKLDESSSFIPPGRLDGRFSAPFWTEVIRRSVTSDLGARFNNGIELLHFVLGAVSTVTIETDQVVKHLWNPKALLQHEQDVEREIKTKIKTVSTRPHLVHLYGGRSHSAMEIARRTALLVNHKGPNVISFGGFLRESVDSVLEEMKPLIIDCSDEAHRFSSEDILAILRIFALKQTERSITSQLVTVIESRSSRLLERKQDLDPFFDVVEISCAQIQQADLIDPAPYFSGVRVSSELIGRLRNLGCTTSDKMIVALEQCLAWNSLDIANGEISLHSMMGAELLSRIPQCLADADTQSSSVRCLHRLLNIVPDGISRESVELLALYDSKIQLAIAKGVDHQFFWSIDGKRLTSARVPRSEDIDVESEIVEDIRRLCDVMREPYGSDIFRGSSEAIVCRALGSRPKRRDARRLIAYGVLLLKRGKVFEAYRLLGVPLDVVADDVRTHARWHETRSRVLGVVGKCSESIKEAEKACEYFLLQGRECLAGRLFLDLSVEAAGWSKLDISDELRNRAAEILRESSGTLRLRQVIASEQAQSLLSRREYEGASKIVNDLLSLPRLDSRARAVCSRLAALLHIRLGNTIEAKSSYYEAVRASRLSCDRKSVARVLNSVAIFHFSRGYYVRARRLVDRVMGSPKGTVRNSDEYGAWITSGGVAFESGMLGRALEVNVRAYALCEQSKDVVRVGNVETNIALILREMGRIPESLAVARRSIDRGHHRWSMQAHRIVGVNYCDLGKFDCAEDYLSQSLSWEDDGRSPLVKPSILIDFAVLEYLRGEVKAALCYARDAESQVERLNARDEIIEAKYLMIIFDPLLQYQNKVTRLKALEQKAIEVGGKRMLSQIQASIAELDESIPIKERIQSIDRLLEVALSNGHGSFVLRLLEVKARLLIEDQSPELALDVLRECLNRIKVVADGLRDPALRKTYLADPRRQRILELIRSAKKS